LKKGRLLNYLRKRLIYTSYGQDIGAITSINMVYRSIKAIRSGNIVGQESKFDVTIYVKSWIWRCDRCWKLNLEETLFYFECRRVDSLKYSKWRHWEGNQLLRWVPFRYRTTIAHTLKITNLIFEHTYT
jgi:hypothetical protein